MSPRSSLAALLVVTCCALPLAAQVRDRTLSPRADPYTRGDPAACAKAGIVGTGPFPIDARVSSADIDRLLGHESLLWLETARFRIGAELPALPWRGLESRERRALEAELARLRTCVPIGTRTPRELEPWLRMHLLAQRCEALYARFSAGLASLPPKPAATARNLGAARLTRDASPAAKGEGPYLGKSQKFVVLILRTRVELARVSAEFFGQASALPRRHDLGLEEGMLFLTALDCDPSLAREGALHAHLVHNLVHALGESYRGHLFATPNWWRIGLAHAEVRRIDPRCVNFDRELEARADARVELDWDSIAAGLARHGGARPFAESGRWFDFAPYRFHDHVLAWSRVEFLLARERTRACGEARFLRFMAQAKAPSLQPGSSDETAILAMQSAALLEVYGFASDAEFDTAWRAWASRRR